MIVVNDIHLSFDGRPILKGVTFEIPDDCILGIAGASGSGKTSLLKIISGYLDADNGTVMLNDKRVVGPSQRLIPGHSDIELVNQDFALDLYHTVEENLQNRMVHLHRNQQREFIDELLDLLQITHVRTQKAIHLSGGEQQRLSIGRALAKEPEVLILDEPFAHLDYNTKMRMLSYLTALKKVRKCTLILVSHDVRDLFSLSDKLVILEDGKVLREGKPKALYYSERNLNISKMLGLVNVIQIDGIEVMFRPDEYEVCGKEKGVRLQFVTAHFMGDYYLNECLTSKKETLFLTHKEALTHVSNIQICKKQS